MEVSELPEFLKPRLRLFLSADIVGSTALKQALFGAKSKPDQRALWVSKIQGFYFEAAKAFFDRCTEMCSDPAAGQIFGEQPRLWKTIGDEVLFVKNLTDHRQVALVLECWKSAVDQMRSFLKKDGSRLDIKSTAWTAGFPFRNSEVAVSSDSSLASTETGEWFVEGGRILNQFYRDGSVKDVQIDYIGPSIDVGFRLTSFSSSRKFVISVEVAYILAVSAPSAFTSDCIRQVFYDGSHSLKGVLGGVSYPVFWLDFSNDNALARVEDQLTNIRAVDRDTLSKFCRAFFSEHSYYTFAPFIRSESEQTFTDIPEWYLADLEALASNFVDDAEPEPEPEPEPEISVSSSASRNTAKARFVQEYLNRQAHAGRSRDHSDGGA
jgi:hypothetical protein